MVHRSSETEGVQGLKTERMNMYVEEYEGLIAALGAGLGRSVNRDGPGKNGNIPTVGSSGYSCVPPISANVGIRSLV